MNQPGPPSDNILDLIAADPAPPAAPQGTPADNANPAAPAASSGPLCPRCAAPIGGLTPGAPCPKCGTTDAARRAAELLELDDPAHVQRLLFGARTAVWGARLTFWLACAMAAVALFDAAWGVQLVLWIAMPCAWLFGRLGWWKLAAAENTRAVPPAGNHLCRPARVVLGASAAVAALCIMLLLLLALDIWSQGVILTALALMALLLLSWHIVGSMLLAALAERLPDFSLARNVRVTRWLGPLGVVLSLLVCNAVLSVPDRGWSRIPLLLFAYGLAGFAALLWMWSARGQMKRLRDGLEGCLARARALAAQPPAAAS